MIRIKRPDFHIYNITQKNMDLKGYYAKVDNSLKSRKIKWFLTNDHMPLHTVSLPAWRSYRNLFVKDTKGNLETRYYAIQKIHKEKVLQICQQMLLAILPLDIIGTDKCNYQYQRYFYSTLLKSFKDTGRFNLVEENRLEHLFSGDLLQTACKVSTMCDENLAQLIGTETPADGINRNIIHKEGEIIDMDKGLDKKILPYMINNIFEEETYIITKDSGRYIRNVTFEAEISEA